MRLALFRSAKSRFCTPNRTGRKIYRSKIFLDLLYIPNTFKNMARLVSLFPNIEETLQKLPARPGVYLMKDVDGGILYVGKAKRLKHRVRSYFSKSGL